MTDRDGPTQVSTMQETFRVFFEEHFDYVYRSLRRLGVQERDLEDVTHDLFVQVHAELPGYDASRPPKPWLFAFAFRFASDYRRLGRHRTVPTADMDRVHDVPGAEAAYLDAERRALLATALEALDFDQRVVVLLHEIDGATVPEIADALGIPLNTAYSRLRLGREALTAAVKRLRAKER